MSSDSQGSGMCRVWFYFIHDKKKGKEKREKGKDKWIRRHEGKFTYFDVVSAFLHMYIRGQVIGN